MTEWIEQAFPIQVKQILLQADDKISIKEEEENDDDSSTED